MGLMGSGYEARRLQRAQAILEEHLRHQPGGLPGIAVVDRLRQWGFEEREALDLLLHLRHEGKLTLVSGHWVLAQ